MQETGHITTIPLQEYIKYNGSKSTGENVNWRGYGDQASYNFYIGTHMVGRIALYGELGYATYEMQEELFSVRGTTARNKMLY